MEDRFYIDYRIGIIVKNLDTTYLAPEQYNEIEINDTLKGMFRYAHEDDQGQLLSFTFDPRMLPIGGLQVALEQHHERHHFVSEHIVSKIMYLSQEEFDRAYKKP